ncbi:uncharacterized protein LOC143370216 isoform X2 [Andrena cerasifolii]|uniref:uncharacterized protein LOC143370216 isoform X2 n=1 Tax=Andrena cerasifolii TaxID=2819439 RepID=UPI004037F8C7
MENEAFEEEHHPRIQEAATFSQQPSPLPFRPGIDLFADLSVSNSDGHVYEDILPGVEEVSTLSNASFVQDLARSSASVLQRHLDVVDYVSREPTAKSPEQAEVSTFRRNLTLPFRSSAGLDASATSCSSVRVTSREKNSCPEEDADDAEAAARNDARTPLDDAFAPREGQVRAQSGCRPNRRRRKKDCKHCRSKAAASANEEHQEAALGNNQQPRSILDPCNLGMLTARSPGGMAERKELAGPGTDPTVFTISENVGGSPGSTLKLIEYERNDAGPIRETNDGKALITPEKNRAGMRVNSIYSQDRWYAKEAPIFSTDVKEHGTFQRAYSLPARTQTPSSQNRVNLRRSVRGEPPPHPARLHKHRRGWTLHLASPLESSKRTRSLILLLILMLALLGIGGVALYIVFEPEKLQIIQQYLKSSASTASRHNTLSAGTFFSSPKSDQENDTSTATPASSSLPASVVLSDDQSFPDNSTGTSSVLESETETEDSSPSSLNSTRYCDDCLAEEVCVAIVDEPVPICRIGIDREDPTGCAGFCLINKQKCHRLDVDAFRCVEVEHYCLDDEWACSNTLCIPLEKRCDGHMNCYDHSDEYNCACDPETHFQCGNETSCLPLEKRCDGKIDCWDAADEINCTLGRNLGRSCPLENEFTCSNGQCILKARFCDGLPDCLDGSDEPHGCQGRCNKHEFTCQNNRCIAKGMKCNGVDDCGDGTDERHCKDRFP